MSNLRENVMLMVLVDQLMNYVSRIVLSTMLLVMVFIILAVSDLSLVNYFLLILSGKSTNIKHFRNSRNFCNLSYLRFHSIPTHPQTNIPQ